MKKSWQDKLNDCKDLPKIIRLKETEQIHWGGKTMVVPAPLEVNEVMAGIPR